MKRKFEHPEPSERELNGPRYWRSLDELAATPGFQEQLAREFPEGASELEGVDRRHFFRIMAASFALGGMGLAAGCRRPEARILPYGKSVEGVIPGLPQFYATAMPLRKGAVPLLAETHQGRPTKLEGNPSYLPYGGTTNLVAQAALLDLYDPDRATAHLIRGAVATPAAIQDLLAGIGRTYAGGGAGLAFLSEESSSPTRQALVARLRARFPQAIWSEYEATTDELPSTVAREVFGADVKPVYRFDRAKRILSIDADFLAADSNSIGYARDYAKGRRVTKPTDPMNRLYVAESTMTLTGMMADHRLRLASSHMLAFASALAARVTGDATFNRLSQGIQFKDQDRWLDAAAEDLKTHRGACVVVAGSHLPAAVHAVAHALNQALGNVGSTVEYVTVPATPAAPIGDLATAIRDGRVRTLVILGGNPAYNAPADLDLPALLKSVPDVVRYGYYVDETSELASAHVAATHFLEAWGDARTADGTVVAIQPQILPLFGGLTDLEVLARIAGETTTDPYTLVHDTIVALAGGNQAAFPKFLHDGLLEGSGYPRAQVSITPAALTRVLNAAAAPVEISKDSLEVRFVSDYKMDDGRFANNGWLQECPHPITKIAWDNPIMISPRLAKELGVYPGGSLIQVARVEQANFQQGKERAFIGEVTINGRTVRGPLHIQPGLSNYTIVLPLGYGRTVTGRVGKGAGYNFYPIRTTAGLHFATGAKLVATEDQSSLANTQEHWSMEGRDIIREANLTEFQENPAWVDSFGIESHAPANLGKDRNLPLPTTAVTTPRGNSLYDHPDFDGVHQWGMSIDMNTCIACNACVIACQAENNIPIVGKDQVLRGREMHWIRIDRYFSDGNAESGAFGGEGNKEIPEDPQVSVQPMLCVHCELAPCEIVCPVNATVHDEEGLNTMAYNRCIGTRYCANNCPYKVRRFNFFDWNKRQLDSLYLGPLGPGGMPELVQMAKNPEVSVRMRGVMEKCTYCVQRIQNAKIKQKVKAGASNRVEVPDGTIKTACQQVCPVEAIVFGNIKDPNSAVSKAKAREQDYAVLGYLNTRPRTTYLGRFRNPNPQMPDYAALPASRKEYNDKNHPAHGEHGEHGHGPAHGGAEGDHGKGGHEAQPKKEPGHTALETAKLFGGLS